MYRDSRSRSVGKALPGAGFWIAVSFGALLFIFGSTLIVLDLRYYRPDLSKHAFPLLATIAVGMLMMSLAFVCERPGRLQRPFVIVRNSLIALIAFLVALILLLLATGAATLRLKTGQYLFLTAFST